MVDAVDPASLDPMRDQSPAPTTAGAQDQSQSSIWSRIQDALKRGLISSDQYQQLAAKMGYTPQNVAQTPTPQNGKMAPGSFASGVKEPDYAAGQSSLAGGLGAAAGNIVGSTARGIYDKATAPAAPGAPLDINPPQQPNMSDYANVPNDGKWPTGSPPSPAWNQ